MRNINVVKYRKLLRELQYFCRTKKSNLWNMFSDKKYLTDYERGYIAGQHGAYNEALREMERMVVRAEVDWDYVHCREENVKS